MKKKKEVKEFNTFDILDKYIEDTEDNLKDKSDLTMLEDDYLDYSNDIKITPKNRKINEGGE